jgi:hypothetical protein
MRTFFYSFVVLTCVLAPVTGCNVDTSPDDAGNEGLSSSNGDEAPDPPETPVLSEDALPDFSVVDANSASPRFREAVSPRDYLGEISAWYFGHST